MACDKAAGQPGITDRLARQQREAADRRSDQLVLIRRAGEVEAERDALVERVRRLREILHDVSNERDRLREQADALRKGLEFLRTCEPHPIWVFRARKWSAHERTDGYEQPAEVFLGLLAAAVGVPVEALTGGAADGDVSPLRSLEG